MGLFSSQQVTIIHRKKIQMIKDKNQINPKEQNSNCNPVSKLGFVITKIA
jgi:hypothetical protein